VDAQASYLTVDEAATMARCHPKTIRRAVGSGALRGFRPAQRVLLREDDVRAWIERRAAISSPPPARTRAKRRRAVPGSVEALRAIEREAMR
jgi:excisionase family DNA binding protein